MTSAGAGSEAPLPLKGAQLPSGAPACRRRPACAPRPGHCGEGRPHKRGSRGRGDSGGAGSGRPRLPSLRRRPAPPSLIARPAPDPPDARTPPAPGARDEVGAREGRAGGDLPHAELPGSRADSPGNQTRDGPALPAAPGQRVRRRWGRRAGAGIALGAPARTAPRAGREPRERGGLTGQRHARPLRAGRRGRAAGRAGEGLQSAAAAAGPGSVAAARLGRGEAEKARRGRLPSGGLREMQLSLRGCRQGHKWGRAGRSGAAGGVGARLRRPRAVSRWPAPFQRGGKRTWGSGNLHGCGGWRGEHPVKTGKMPSVSLPPGPQ